MRQARHGLSHELSWAEVELRPEKRPKSCPALFVFLNPAHEKKGRERGWGKKGKEMQEYRCRGEEGVGMGDALTGLEASLARMSRLRTDEARASGPLSLVAAGVGASGSVPRGGMVVVSLPLIVDLEGLGVDMGGVRLVAPLGEFRLLGRGPKGGLRAVRRWGEGWAISGKFRGSGWLGGRCFSASDGVTLGA